MVRVLVVGTRDTKEAELDYVGSLVEATGCEAVQVDVGTRSDGSGADVTPDLGGTASTSQMAAAIARHVREDRP